MLGFAVRGEAEYRLPALSRDDEKILERFFELYVRGKDAEKVLERLFSAAEKKGLSFSRENVLFWSKALISELGALKPIVDDPEIEEIMVNGIGKEIFVYHRKKGMLRTNLSITSREYFLNIANRILARLGRRVDLAHPSAHGILGNGDRISVVIPPHSTDFVMDIRKFTAKPLSIPFLISNGTIKAGDAAFLWLCLEAGNINIGVVGNTGAGKTTLLNALLRFIPPHERIILVEEVPEIKVPHEQVVRLISNENLGISMRDSIIESLRLRPDRVVVGEVRRDEEVEALHESCLAGQALGTYFTYHADSAKLALRRLVNQGFPEFDLEAIHVLVVVKRKEVKGKLIRRVEEVFVNNRERVEKVLDEAFGDWEAELRARESFLEEISRRGVEDEEFFRSVWSR